MFSIPIFNDWIGYIVLFYAICLIGSEILMKIFPSGSTSNPMDEKIKIYDKNGNIIGYQDKPKND